MRKGKKWTDFGRFSLWMHAHEARACSHPGPCDSDVEALLKAPHIGAQLDAIPPDKIAAELREYGAWDETELQDHRENRARIIWCAACNIRESMR